MHTAVLAGGTAALGLAAERAARRSPIALTLVTAVATWIVLGGKSLEREASAVHAHLAAGGLPGARDQLTHLVGRDTSQLGPGEIARAVVESVAENTSDAVVAPLLWGAVAGIPGLLGYRAANTLDAMIGHRNARYERYGWASARLDDLLNLPAARLAGLLTLAAAPSRAAAAWRVWRRDAAAHPSPNAGVIEAAFAGALGVRLGGTNVYYGNRIEHRAIMDGGKPPEPRDIPRATRLARRVGHAAAATAALLALASFPGHARPDAGRMLVPLPVRAEARFVAVLQAATDQHAGGCLRLHPGRPARPEDDPGQGGAGTRLRPPGGADATGRVAVRPGRARSLQTGR